MITPTAGRNFVERKKKRMSRFCPRRFQLRA